MSPHAFRQQGSWSTVGQRARSIEPASASGGPATLADPPHDCGGPDPGTDVRISPFASKGSPAGSPRVYILRIAKSATSPCRTMPRGSLIGRTTLLSAGLRRRPRTRPAFTPARLAIRHTAIADCPDPHPRPPGRLTAASSSRLTICCHVALASRKSQMIMVRLCGAVRSVVASHRCVTSRKLATNVSALTTAPRLAAAPATLVLTATRTRGEFRSRPATLRMSDAALVRPARQSSPAGTGRRWNPGVSPFHGFRPVRAGCALSRRRRSRQSARPRSAREPRR